MVGSSLYLPDKPAKGHPHRVQLPVSNVGFNADSLGPTDQNLGLQRLCSLADNYDSLVKTSLGMAWFDAECIIKVSLHPL